MRMKAPLKTVDTKSHLELAQLYHGLARDAFRVANRQYKYSKEAYGEKKFSDRDLRISKKNGHVMSMLDDEHESDICKEFSKHRKALADLYYQLGLKYDKEAKIHMRLARSK